MTISASISRTDFGTLAGDESSGRKIYDYLCFLRCVPPSPKQDATAADSEQSVEPQPPPPPPPPPSYTAWRAQRRREASASSTGSSSSASALTGAASAASRIAKSASPPSPALSSEGGKTPDVNETGNTPFSYTINRMLYYCSTWANLPCCQLPRGSHVQ